MIIQRFVGYIYPGLDQIGEAGIMEVEEVFRLTENNRF
jgi:hypothetical protein